VELGFPLLPEGDPRRAPAADGGPRDDGASGPSSPPESGDAPASDQGDS